MSILRQGRGNLLCIANYPPNTGYAWEFIESLYAGLADDLAEVGVRTWVAYPRLDEPPESLAGSCAQPIELGVRFGSIWHTIRLLPTLWRMEIRTVYLTDWSAWHIGYALVRLAGVRNIVVHDHASGEQKPAEGIRALLKRLVFSFGPGMADLVLAVSEYVRDRKVNVDLVPPERVEVLLNSVELPVLDQEADLRQLLAVPDDRPIVACAARAAEYKGIQHLLQAFDRVHAGFSPKPVLVYIGDGPYMDTLRSIRQKLPSRADIRFLGYRKNAARLLGGADIAVVPSTWQEAFGLAALEPASYGVPVVASQVGGIPEVVRDGVTGILVPPGDPEAIARGIGRLLSDPDARRTMGARGRRLAAERFSRERQLAELTALFKRSLGIGSESRAASP